MICIDVTDYGARVAALKGKGAKASVSDCVTLTSENRILSGAEVNEAALVELLRPELEKRRGKAAVTFSTLPVTSNDYLLPPVKGKREIHTAVLSKVFAGLSSEEYLVGYRTSPAADGGLTANAYVMPKAVVEAAHRVLTELKLRPDIFAPAQDCVDAAADAFELGEHIVIANVDKNALALHLINRPDATLTRLSEFVGGVDKAAETADRISKLLQYQQIKFPETPVQKVLITGCDADEELISAVRAELDAPVSRLKLGDVDGSYIYAVGAAI